MVRSDPTYEELADVIARYIHSHLYREELRVDGSWERNVDNMCLSAYQIATGVLNRLSILAPMDDLDRRNAFSCEPADFPKIIAYNKSKGCSYEMLVLALICLLVQDKDDLLQKYCVKLGLCEPGDSREIKWTPKAERINALYARWPELLRDSMSE